MDIRSDAARPTQGLPVIYGAIHALIDLTTVSVVFRAVSFHNLDPADAFGIVLGYDLIAFGTQFLFGLLADRFRAARLATVLGIALAAFGVLALPAHALAAMLLAGTGNALFHLGAGAFVLRLDPQRAAPAGLFVAPGALGLGLGLYVGKHPELGSLLPLLLALAIAASVALLVRNPQVVSPSTSPSPLPRSRRNALVAVVVLLMVSIAIRSLVGMGASWHAPKGTTLLIGVPLAAFAGKTLGGLISDRLGWVETSVGALLVSAPLIAFGGHNLTLLLPGLALFQMTMPVTLSATALAVPNRPATAFGLTTLALILGALPTFFPWGKALYSNMTFFVLVLVSAAVVFLGLRTLGPPRGPHRPAVPLPPKAAGLLLVLVLATIPSNAEADVAPPPNYVESCTVDRVQGSGEVCESCSAWHGEVDACDKSLGSHGYVRRCRSRGASAWSEVWCKAASPDRPPVQDRRYAVPPGDDPSQVAPSSDNERPRDRGFPSPPPPRGCGGCTSGTGPSLPAFLLLAGAISVALLSRSRRR